MNQRAPAVRLLEEVRVDLRYAARTLRGAPAFAATAILVLALGIGATTALFSAVKGLLLDPGMFASAPVGLNVVVGERAEIAEGRLVSGGYFDLLGVRAQIGRAIGSDDDERSASPVAVIVNQAAAREYFGGGDPLGRRLGQSVEARGEIEVVGVVRDVKYKDVRAAAPPTIYRPHAQTPEGGRVFEVKTAVPPRSLTPAVREALRRVDPNLPLTQVSTQAEEIEKRFSQERLLAFAYSLFGGLAMLLAAIGLFGLASYGVAQRTNEIGIRMARVDPLVALRCE